MRMLQQVWKDDAGFVVSTELVLIATLLVIGMVVGLATVRDAVVQELGDVKTAIGNINQSYSYSGVSGCNSDKAGSNFKDETDACEHPIGRDPQNNEPWEMAVQELPTNEGDDMHGG